MTKFTPKTSGKPSISIPIQEIPVSCCKPDVSTTSCCESSAAANTTSSSQVWQLLKPLQSAWTLVVLIPVLVAILDQARLGEVLTIAVTALSSTAPYILFAVLMIAYLKASGAENVVAKAFEGRENRMIVFAALFGGLAPFCSCEVIPFVAGLLALGAPLSAVMAFWLSSPLIDPPSLMITAAALGWEFAIGKALAAVLLGLFGGFSIKFLLYSGAFQAPLKATYSAACSSGTCNSNKPFQAKPHWKFWQQASRIKIFKDEALANAKFLFMWLTLAYMLEALLIIYVPASLIGGFVGGEGLLPIVIGAFLGMPAYLNSYAAPPLVSGLMEHGMTIGAAMAFMIAGSISSIPAMTAVWSLVKKQVFFVYLSLGIGGAILFGIVFEAVMLNQ